MREAAVLVNRELVGRMEIFRRGGWGRFANLWE